ncbi:MAG: penicillin-binding protein activator [Aeromicrobium sp.]|nr:penicillin-binding protein activator [Burkholderiales bacterium]
MTTPMAPSTPAQVSPPPDPIAAAVQNEVTAVMPPAVVSEPAEPPIPHLALLLPLSSKIFGKAADALRLGFIAGADADGKNAAPYRIYPADDEGPSLAAQYRKAITEGASAIVGGLTRDGASTIAREYRFVPTLALNAPAITLDHELPDHFFYISLNLDLEARLVARMAFADGLRTLAMVAASNQLAKRIQDSFELEWVRLGGGIVARISFGSDPADAARVTNAMEKLSEKAGTQTDGVFLAADPGAARFIRPYLPAGMSVFVTSHSIDPRAEAIANIDLENVRFLEMPWFAEPDHPAVMAYAKPAQTLPVELERLYALGIDAWRLGQLIAKFDRARALPPLDGVTGRIVPNGQQLTRTLSSVEVRDGKSQLRRLTE